MKHASPLLLLAFGLFLSLAACAPPADPVSMGAICYPAEEDCLSETLLVRPGPGRNALEFTLIADESSDLSNARLRITTSEALNIDRPADEEGHLILFQQNYSLPPGERLRERLGSYTLTIARELRVELLCLEGPCRHRLEFVAFSEHLDCYDDNLCGRGEFCEQAYGRCAECSENSQCSTNQTCDLETGACFPGGGAGCSHLAQTATPPLPLLFFLLFAALFLLSRSPSTGTRIRAGLLAFLLLFPPLLLTPADAAAAGRASLSAGGGTRLLTGELRREARVGWGISIHQEIRNRRLGAAFELSTHSFTLRDEDIPNELRLTGYGVALGPRLFLPLPFFGLSEYPLEFAIGVDYLRWSVAENRLAHLTGLDLSYHAVGPALSLSWTWNGLKFQARSRQAQIFNWPGGVFAFDLSAGIGF